MTADSTAKIKPVGVYVLGIDKVENNGPIYDALRAIGFAWCGQALSLNEGLRQLELIQGQVHLVVVRAELARSGEEAALLEPLARWPLAVLVGAARTMRRDDIGRLSKVHAVIGVPPYDLGALHEIYRELYGQLNPTAAAPTPVTRPSVQPTPARVAPSALPATVESDKPSTTTPTRPVISRAALTQTRVAFYGQHGGVGTSTAALQAAQLLAGQGVRVALFDVWQRGDLHLMLGAQPAAQPLQQGSLTVYLGEPTEDLACRYEAIVIDASRQRSAFNAQWIEVQRPFDEAALRRLLGLPPAEQGNTARPARRLGLPKFLSIEVTE